LIAVRTMREDSITRKLAAILYTDVAGYNRLTGVDEEATHRALSLSLDAITATIEDHGGKVLHYAGDAILAEFASVVVAVTCAIDIQRDLAARNHGLSECLSPLKLGHYSGTNEGRTRWPGNVILTKIY
jgi:class 3 adenylate cyclase